MYNKGFKFKLRILLGNIIQSDSCLSTLFLENNYNKTSSAWYFFSCPTLTSLQSPTDHVRVYHENPIAREIRHIFIMQKRKKNSCFVRVLQCKVL